MAFRGSRARDGRPGASAKDLPTIFPQDKRSTLVVPVDDEDPLPMLFPMFLMSWDVLMSLGEMSAHQVLRRRKQFVELSDSMFGLTIFISHEWLSSIHPDPRGEQWRTLQTFLARLASGTVAVESDFRYQLCLRKNERVSGCRWKVALPRCHFWLDYSSVPQPRIALPASFVDFSDDVHGEDLARAVRSIPAYVETSSLLLVLAPTLQHSDDASRVCDLCSWSRRGWCRVEAFCAHLARNMVRILPVVGPTAQASFVMSSLIVQTHGPLYGEYTCCRLGHELDGQPIPCDKDGLRGVIASLLKGSAAHAWRIGDTNKARFLWCHAEKWLRGAPGSPDASPPSLDLESFRAAMRWTDFAPPGTGRRCCGMRQATAWTLLHWAALAGHAAVVSTLIEQGGGDVMDARAGAIPEFGIDLGLTPLHFACIAASGNFDAAAVLLDARADPSLRSAAGYCPQHTLAVLGSAQQLEAWLSRCPASVHEKDSNLGYAPLNCALTTQYPCNEHLQVFRRHGADLQATTNMQGVEAALYNACGNICPDVQAIRSLLEARCWVNVKVKPDEARWRSTYFIAETLAKVGQSMGRASGTFLDFLASTRGQTPLHAAIVNNGSLELIRLLIDARASLNHRTHMGRTPLQAAQHRYGGELPDLLAHVLRG